MFEYIKEGDFVRYIDDKGYRMEARVTRVGVAHLHAGGISFSRNTGEAMLSDAKLLGVAD